MNQKMIDNCTYDGNETFIATNDTFIKDIPTENVYILPWWQQTLWSLAFGGMVLVATGGNVIVIWIVLAHKRMRTVTNYFLVNLSLADTMVSTLNVIFNFSSMLNGDWPFGSAYCKVSNFISILSVAASVFTLMAISIDRYMAIMHPLKPRMSRVTTLNITLWIWVASSTLSLPNILYSTTMKEIYPNGDYRVICYMIWPDGPTTQSYTEYIYNVMILVLAYILPITSMTFTYFRVGQELWGSQSIGECTAAQIEAIKSKRKIVKMMIVVVFIFAVCWLPYHTYFLLAHHHREITSYKNIQHIYLGIYWLAMSNSMYNPIIYCWMNSRFRQGFKKVFMLCFCRLPEDTMKLYEQRHQAVARNSCSEPYADTRVTFNGNINVPLHTVTETLNGSGNSSSSLLLPKYGPKGQKLSNV
ncbi:tachykinin-like peptides receptor 99D isoform X1 [Limulus polyphemus]|uniref:Tachykinin-like peptides receptor 99D isoform X1 n=1 Tax=Limulus polyphemus TaxID=6850 RepID=A0ABM1SFU3_LIMPO|nr:tachykinin-like peptides receptor 99D isoform X1 [Limulus polyphemus]XP_022242498.1 tachykinin-like peptides receptor 99D isoform X1 [Limulus polyphemus]